jgi:hypothetical protein
MEAEGKIGDAGMGRKTLDQGIPGQMAGDALINSHSGTSGFVVSDGAVLHQSNMCASCQRRRANGVQVM